MTLKERLQQAYPLDEDGKVNWKISLLFGLFVGFFLWFFTPFGLDSARHANKVLAIWGYGLITTVLMIGNCLVFIYFFKAWYNEKDWNIGREILRLAWNILTIAIANWLYSRYLLSWQTAPHEFLFFLLVTLGIGLIPSTFLVLWNANRLLRKHLKEVSRLNESKIEKAVVAEPELDKETDKLDLIAENQKDRLDISAEQLYFIRSADNYVEVWFRENGQLQKKLLRSSLSRVEKMLADIPHILRCHRAYIVNLHQVEDLKGDSQGYKLRLCQMEHPVPVSRRYTQTVKELYR